MNDHISTYYIVSQAEAVLMTEVCGSDEYAGFASSEITAAMLAEARQTLIHRGWLIEDGSVLRVEEKPARIFRCFRSGARWIKMFIESNGEEAICAFAGNDVAVITPSDVEDMFGNIKYRICVYTLDEFARELFDSCGALAKTVDKRYAETHSMPLNFPLHKTLEEEKMDQDFIFGFESIDCRQRIVLRQGTWFPVLFCSDDGIETLKYYTKTEARKMLEQLLTGKEMDLYDSDRS